MIEEACSLSIKKQAELLSVSRSSHYYEHKFSEYELKIMGIIDEIYTEHQYYGSRRISKELQAQGHDVGRKQVRRFMGIMGICALYPKPKTSISNKEHKVYPYLLKGVKITRPNQVRSTDITYIKLPTGFVYLVAIIDWYSRYIIFWDIGITMDKELCIGVLEKALSKAKPEIFNSDQGSQFTSKEFTNTIESHGIKISMDGVGRCFDNIRIERLRRTIKYEDIHLHDYQTPNDVYHGLNLYIEKYNNRRLHSSLDYRTPSKAYKD